MRYFELVDDTGWEHIRVANTERAAIREVQEEYPAYRIARVREIHPGEMVEIRTRAEALAKNWEVDTVKYHLKYRQVQEVNLLIEADNQEKAEEIGDQEMDRLEEYCDVAGESTAYDDTSMAVSVSDRFLQSIIEE